MVPSHWPNPGPITLASDTVVLPDGRIDVDGHVFDTPSGAARWVSGKSENGWWFFNVGANDHRALAEVWNEYLDQVPDASDDDVVGEADDSLFDVEEDT